MIELERNLPEDSLTRDGKSPPRQEELWTHWAILLLWWQLWIQLTMLRAHFLTRGKRMLVPKAEMFKNFRIIKMSPQTYECQSDMDLCPCSARVSLKLGYMEGILMQVPACHRSKILIFSWFAVPHSSERQILDAITADMFAFLLAMTQWA